METPLPPSPSPSMPRFHLTTAAQVLTHSSSLFVSHLPTFILLALLIFTFRSNLDTGASLLTSFLDTDPSLAPLLRRIDLPSNQPPPAPRRRRRPFLHLTRVGTIEDDFFSSDHHRSSPRPPPRNSTPVFLSFNYYSNNISNDDGDGNYRVFDNGIRVNEIVRVFDNGIRVNELVHPGFSFKIVDNASQSVNDSEELREDDSVVVKQEDDGEGDVRERVVDLGFLVKGLELRRQDASALFFLVSLLSAAYGYVIAGFIVTYSWVLGIVFLRVVNHYLGRNRSYFRTIWDGSTLGLTRLSGFILMKWAVRDALTQLLGLWYFGEIEDQYSFFKIFVRLKLMPFSITTSWIRGFEKETAGFMFAWLLLDFVVEFVFALDSWVAIVDSRRTGREIVKEGCYLLSLMLKPAVTIKCWETVLCGSYLKWSLARYFGKLFGTAFQSLMEAYFMVVWLIFYLAVRSMEATSLGRTFGRRELEGFIQGHR